ncbi:MAG: type II toxin-antitoxin system RelE/ParE family toxin [Hyphomonadaceae bacterium]|nr:type II toxin-antitoxin system RelE/ParE family toxin [Hyphomonadaceae bacterium]
MTRALRWSNAARRDLMEIWRWRGRQHPEAGDQILDRIEAACVRLIRFPHLGAPYQRMAPAARANFQLMAIWPSIVSLTMRFMSCVSSIRGGCLRRSSLTRSKLLRRACGVAKERACV